MMFDKAKMALAMLSPGMQRKVSLLMEWVDGLLDAMNRTDVEVPVERVESEEDFQKVMFELLKNARIARIDDKNALIVELGKERKLKLIASFKVVGE